MNAILLKTLGLYALLGILLSSCWNSNTTKKQESDSESTNSNFTIAGQDSVILTDSVFRQYHGSIPSGDEEGYGNEVYFGQNSKDDVRYQTQFFLPKEHSDYSTSSHLLDSIPLWKGMYALLFSNLAYDRHSVNGYYSDTQGWLVIYSSEHKYIDSRLIYQEKETTEHRKENTYSRLYLPKRKLVILNNSNFEDVFWEIPLVIHENGTFEEFPDTPFSKKDIAIMTCNGNGLYGKYSLKQDWTLFNFEDTKIAQAKTNHIAQDELGNMSTQFLNPNELPIIFDIAFKGAYTKKEIEILSPAEEKDKEMKHFVEQNLPAEVFIEQSKVDTIQLYSIELNQRKFWMAMVKHRWAQGEANSDYEVLIGITPDKKVVLLANRCAYHFHILRLKDIPMLYVQRTSCGEGALGHSYLYKMENGFENIFDEEIVCD